MSKFLRELVVVAVIIIFFGVFPVVWQYVIPYKSGLKWVHDVIFWVLATGAAITTVREIRKDLPKDILGGCVLLLVYFGVLIGISYFSIGWKMETTIIPWTVLTVATLLVYISLELKPKSEK